MTELEGQDGWDVFISYAREDYQKAKAIADKLLLECVTPKGVPPRIFLDIDREGTPVGVDWEKFLEEVMPRSRYIVALYSRQYFSAGGVCMWELHRAVDLMKAGKVRLVPILMEEAAQKMVAFTANKLNYLPVTHPDWFERLRDALGLRKAADRRRLRFETAVPHAVVNHTLPTIRVAVTGADGTPVLESGETITLTTLPPEPGLNGTLVIPTVRGEAAFTDLSFRRPLESVQLVAQAPGCEPAKTPPIQVSPPAPQPADQDRDHPQMPVSGSPVFFPDGRALAILDGERLTIHTLSRPPCGGEAQLASRPRLWAYGPGRLGVADWTGRVVVATSDGHTHTADLARAPGLAVPGALAFDGHTLLVGMWNGTIWSLADGGKEPELLQEHPAGVQLLAVDGRSGRLLVGDLDGTLTVYEEASVVARYPLERLLLGIHCAPGHTLLVGEHTIYRLDDGAARPLEVDLPVKPLADALVGPELTIALNDEGVGVCLDAELGVWLGFRTVPGARTVCAARDGRLVVFEYPDGSHVLMRDGRIGLTSAHPLAISPDGRSVATSDGRHTLVLPVEELRTGVAEPEPQEETA